MRKRNTYFNTVTTVAAVAFFGFGVFTTTPESLRQDAQDTLAAVGVSVAVAPNQYNTIAQQLSTKEAILTEREAVVAAKEQAISQPILVSNQLGFYSLCVSAILFVLVAANFYLDVRRRSTKEPMKKFSVDLR